MLTPEGILNVTEARDVNFPKIAGNDVKPFVYDHSTGNFVPGANLLTDYLLIDGTRTGASSQAQTFTNGIVGPVWKPETDLDNAIRIQNAAGTSDIITVDTANRRVEIADNGGNYSLKVSGNLLMSGGAADIGIPNGEIMQFGEWDSGFSTFATVATFSGGGFLIGENTQADCRFESRTSNSTNAGVWTGADIYSPLASDNAMLYNNSESGAYCSMLFKVRSSGAAAGRLTFERTALFLGDFVFYARSGGSTIQEVLRATSSGNLTIGGDTINMANQKTPASASATGTAGDIVHDTNYIYVCIATDTWKRAALATW